MDEDFSLLQPIDLITKDVNQLQQMIKEKRKALEKDRDKELGIDKEHDPEHGKVKERERRERDRDRAEKDKECEKKHDEINETDMITDQSDKVVSKTEETGLSGPKHEGGDLS